MLTSERGKKTNLWDGIWANRLINESGAYGVKNSDVKWIFDLAARGMRDSMEISKAHRGTTQHISTQKSNAVQGELQPEGWGGFTVSWSHEMTCLVQDYSMLTTGPDKLVREMSSRSSAWNIFWEVIITALAIWLLQCWSKGVVFYMYGQKEEGSRGMPPSLMGHSWILPAHQCGWSGHKLHKLHRHLAGTEAKWESVKRESTCKVFLIAAKYG